MNSVPITRPGSFARLTQRRRRANSAPCSGGKGFLRRILRHGESNAMRPRASSPRALNAEERQAVLDALHSRPLADKAPADAYALHPERFVRGIPKPSRPSAEVWINPPENVAIRRVIQLSSDPHFVTQVSQRH